jgi:hypothetical protein
MASPQIATQLWFGLLVDDVLSKNRYPRPGQGRAGYSKIEA